MKEIPPYAIGVVTYHARFETHFQPLMRQLSRVFPDREIVVVLNGHPDQTLQLGYLREAARFLSAFPNAKYLAHTDHQSLARCWNQLVILSGGRHLLILNDDTRVSRLFRSEIEPQVGTHPLITVNRSWSHFLIDKEIVRQVGWFDERFLGVGQEDADYAYRLAMRGIPIKDLAAAGLRNYAARDDRPGWQNFSKTGAGGKYATVNKEFFDRKWRTRGNSPEAEPFDHVSDFGGGRSPFSLRAGMETPAFYDLALLDAPAAAAPQKKAPAISRWRLLAEKAYFTSGRLAARTLRALRRAFR